ncbi:hypothetical protein NIES4073_49650 [Kalymmatonema gypsitolerans NIES-4073]|nr:hypothetical protein NIES4073_49650 [Scytonema sp. NIES-4073]
MDTDGIKEMQSCLLIFYQVATELPHPSGSPVPACRETLLSPSGTLREQDWTHHNF